MLRFVHLAIVGIVEELQSSLDSAGMSSYPTLTKAPIVEGLIDIRVDRSVDATIDGIRSACDELAAEFPSRQELHQIVAQFTLSPEPTSSSLNADGSPTGMLLRSTDGEWAVQFRLDGFTVSRLMSYTNWAELKDKSCALWKKYCESTKPTKVTRVATRFINRIPLPTGETFDKTFQTNFELGPNLPQAVAGYLLRVVIPFEEQNAVAIVTQSLEGNSTDCFLDLDAFTEQPLGIDQHEMWSQVDKLREVKNRLFFESLTNEALEQFK